MDFSDISLFWIPLGQFGFPKCSRLRFQRWFCTHLYVAGTVGTVLIREVSLFQR